MLAWQFAPHQAAVEQVKYWNNARQVYGLQCLPLEPLGLIRDPLGFGMITLLLPHAPSSQPVHTEVLSGWFLELPVP